MLRTLTLTSPYMSGADVLAVQKRLPRVLTDGVFGPATAQAVKEWRWRTGFPQAVPALGPDGQEILLGIKPLPLAYRLRAKLRKTPVTPPSVGAKAADLMVQWAKDTYVEEPPNSNKVPELQALAKQLGLAPVYQNMGWPWCAFSANLAALSVGGKTATEGLKLGHFNALFVPDIHTHASRNEFGMKIVDRQGVQRGDLVTFNWDGGADDHIGRFLGWNSASEIRTVEGNTSAGAVGSQSNGGGVYVRVRPLSVVTSFIRES